MQNWEYVSLLIPGALIVFFLTVAIDIVLIRTGASRGIIANVLDRLEPTSLKAELTGTEYCRIGYLEKEIDGLLHISFDGGQSWYYDAQVMKDKAEREAEIEKTCTRWSRDWWGQMYREESGLGAWFMDDKCYPLETLGAGSYDLVSVDGGRTYLSLDGWGKVIGLAEETHPGLLRYLHDREARIISECGYIVGGWYQAKDRGQWQMQYCPKNMKNNA